MNCRPLSPRSTLCLPSCHGVSARVQRLCARWYAVTVRRPSIVLHHLFADAKNFTDLQVKLFKPKPFEDNDVEIAITHCGVCGSDVHTLKQGWGDSKLPLVVGHEIVGEAVRVGRNVKEFKVGDRVGVGAQIWSCMQCRQCKDGYENYCPKQVDTYVSGRI